MKFRHLQLAQKRFLFRETIKTSLWALMTQNQSCGRKLISSPLTLGVGASLLTPSHALLPRFLPVGRVSARTTMLLRAAQTCPSGAGVHAVTSRLPRRSGTKHSLPLIKMTGSVLRSDVSIQVQKGKPGPPPTPSSPLVTLL